MLEATFKNYVQRSEKALEKGNRDAEAALSTSNDQAYQALTQAN